MQFQTRYNRIDRSGEINPGPILVERAGYIPAKIQIENLILAGKRLQEHRAEMYDFTELSKIDLDFYDPTRSKNFDIADAFQLKRAVEERLKASQNAQEASGEVQNKSEGDDPLSEGDDPLEKINSPE